MNYVKQIKIYKVLLAVFMLKSSYQQEFHDFNYSNLRTLRLTTKNVFKSLSSILLCEMAKISILMENFNIEKPFLINNQELPLDISYETFKYFMPLESDDFKIETSYFYENSLC